MTTFLFHGDTVRHPAIRHEVGLEIIDPFLFVVHDGGQLVLTNALEAGRLRAALPDAELLQVDELGYFDLIEGGMPRETAIRELAVRALERWGVGAAIVPDDLPVAVAERMIHGATARDGLLEAGGKPLTAERVRAAVRAACADAGAPAPPGIMVVSVLSGGGHDPGSGPLPADLPITIDLWPRDEESGCWADMTRTFVNGTVSDEVATLRDVVREALEAVRAAARPGITGRALYDIAADVVERAGHPTQRTRTPGEPLTHGFYFGLGHGVGLEVHEPPGLGLAGGDPLVAGDVIAVEPGIEGLERIGGVRYEDLLLITGDGCETLTDFPYEL